MRSIRSIKLLLFVASIVAQAAVAQPSAQLPAQAPTQATPSGKLLLREAIQAAPGQTLSVSTLTIGPGYVSEAHSHAGETFVYVLEGRILNQVGDEEPKIYEPGQSFFEHPHANHAQFENLDKEKPATVLIVGIRPTEGN